MAPQRPQGALCSLRTPMPHGEDLGTSHWREKGGSWAGGGPTGGQLCASPVPFSSLQLARNRSKAKDYLHQSQPYLKSLQESLRREAVRFIGEPRAPGSLPLPGSLCPGAQGVLWDTPSPPPTPACTGGAGRRLIHPFLHAAPRA